MNKNIIFYVFSFSVCILCGCQKNFLDQVPKDAITEDVVWGDPNVAQQFVNGIYGDMPSAFDRSYDGWAKGIYNLDGVTDDGDVCMPWTSSHRLQDANFLPSNSPFSNAWGIYFGLVRKANLALVNLDKVPDQAVKNRLKGEAYFLRAFVYHDILRWYGMKSSGSEPTGVPIIDKPLTPQDNFQIPRSTYDQTVKFILNDLAQAETLLPRKSETEAGRATKGAVWALQCRVLLYNEQWGDAAAAAKKVMDAADYSLFPDYRTLFLTKNNSEIIFAKKFQDPDKIHFQVNGGSWDVINSPRSFKGASDAGWGGTVPTQNFVDSYEMTDGLPQSTSPLFNPAKPFDNMDPRFYASVVYNGSTFRGHVMEVYPGGADITGQPEDSKSSYSTRKFHDERFPVYTKSGEQDWIFMRYAEVLLNYAEAQNEAAGPDASVYKAINDIRQRPNIAAPPLPPGLSINMPPLPGGLSQSQMRDRIRNERRIELAFEEHRFFDIRRWRIAESLLNNKPMYGLKINKVGNGFTYTRYTFDTRKYPPRMYVFPIPQSEIDKNPALKQISGW